MGTTHGTGIEESCVSAVRGILDEYLVGVHSHYRDYLFFCFPSENQGEQRPDLCLFLDCILDDSFSNLSFFKDCFHSTPPQEEGDQFYPIKLVETISRRCPSVKEIVFYGVEWESSRSSKALWAQALGSLKNLTKLDIGSWSTKSDNMQFFSYLGSSCPNLKYLELDKWPFQLDQQFALVLGPKAKFIPLPVKKKMMGLRSYLHLLHFSDQDVTQSSAVLILHEMLQSSEKITEVTKITRWDDRSIEFEKSFKRL